jgi:Flp pilus assembly protein TadG
MDMTKIEVNLHRDRKRRISKRGSALVEFALASIILLTFLFGIIDFCRALYAYQFVNYAARQGARYAMVRGSLSCPPYVAAGVSHCNASASDIQNYVRSLNLPGIDPNQITINTTTGYVWPGTGPGCNTGGGAAVNSPGCPVKVLVAYNYVPTIPFLSARTLTMRADSQMVISQ